MDKLRIVSLLLLISAAGFCQNHPTEFQSVQDPPPTNGGTKESGWHVVWVPGYLWFSGVSGNMGVAGRTVPVDASFSDVFDKLNIGFMTAVDVRKHKVGLLTDFSYLDLSSGEVATPFGVAFSSAHADAQSVILDPEIYGRIVDTPRVYADVLAGIRYWHLNSTLDLRPGLLPAFHASDSKDWVDPVLGARFRVNFRKGLFAMLKGDAGGFGAGSDETWQIYTGAGKEFKEKYSLFLGYRHLSVDYRSGGFIFDTNMNGMLLGFGIRFK